MAVRGGARTDREHPSRPDGGAERSPTLGRGRPMLRFRDAGVGSPAAGPGPLDGQVAPAPAGWWERRMRARRGVETGLVALVFLLAICLFYREVIFQNR